MIQIIKTTLLGIKMQIAPFQDFENQTFFDQAEAQSSLEETLDSFLQTKTLFFAKLETQIER